MLKTKYLLFPLFLILLSSCAYQDPRVQAELEEHRRNTLPSGWNVSCNIDEFTDKKECHMVKFFRPCPGCSESESIKINLLQDGKILLSYGLNDNIDTYASVRIDKNKAERYKNTHVTGKQAARLIRQMKKGKSGVAEYWRWPDEHSEPPWGKPHGIKSGVARVQAALAPYLLYPASLCNFE